MISQILMIFTLISIWLSLAWGLVILISAVQFWLKHSDFRVDTSPLLYYPKVTIVVPAHNEDVVIAQTAKAILDMNYPHDRVELLLFADNCSDRTYEECLAVKALPEYAGRDVTIIDRTGTGGKAGVLNDALNTGKYDRGVIVAETFDDEVIDKAYVPYDNLSLLVSLQSSGTIEKKVIASVTEALKADPQFEDWNRLTEIFRKPSLQMTY